jgi:peptidyl-Lys metalloendopeptidase
MNRSTVRFHAFVFVLLAALFLTSAVGAAPKAGPTVSLSVAQSEFNAAQDVLVTITISNPHKHTVRVLRWFTAAQGVEESLFAVTRDGQAVGYIGVHYKRPAITGKDYISLKAGQSISHTVNLADYYDLSQSGQYEVSYAVASFQLFDEKGNAFQLRDSLASEKLSLSIEGRAPKGNPILRPLRSRVVIRSTPAR